MAQPQRNWRSYEEAAAWFQQENITSQAIFRSRKSNGYWPADIPRAPEAVYKEEWKNGGLGRFLGTGRKATQDIRKGFLPLEEAAEWLRDQGIMSSEHWAEVIRQNGRPEFIPSNLPDAYGEEFTQMGGWPGVLQIERDAQRSHVERIIQYVLSDVFDEEHLDQQIQISGKSGTQRYVDCVVKRLKLIVEYDGELYHKDRVENDASKTQDLVEAGWKVVRVRGGKLPLIQEQWDLLVHEQSSPHQRVRQLLEHLAALDECKQLKIPARARRRMEYWVSEGLAETDFRKLLCQSGGKASIEEASQWAQANGIKSNREWSAAVKPANLPKKPWEFYGEQWKSSGVFFGTGRVANRDREFCSLKDMMKWVKDQGIKRKEDWDALSNKDGTRPHWIPANPAKTYGDSWPGWPVVFGKMPYPDGWEPSSELPKSVPQTSLAAKRKKKLF